MAAFKTTLPLVQYYTQADPYYYTVDNRPLVDLKSSIDMLADELDRRTFAVDITGAASCTINRAPTGWTVATNGTGDYTVTHNLNNASYIPQVSIIGATAGTAYVVTYTANTVQVKTINPAGTATHLRFALLIVGY